MVEQTILVNLDEHHNKFWIATYNGSILKKRWGRIGTKGQSQEKHTRSCTYHDDVLKKLRKGYTEVTEEAFEQLTAIATAMGTAHKMSGHEIVAVLEKKDNAFIICHDADLLTEGVGAALIANIMTRQKNGREEWTLFFHLTDIYEITTHGRPSSFDEGKFAFRRCTRHTVEPINETHPLYKKVDAIRKAIGASLGMRK